MAGEDIKNFRLSSKAIEIAEKIKETGRFEDVLTVARFGMAYALKNHFSEITPETYRMPDNNGSNYNVGSLDSDGQLRTLLVALYPGTTTPYLYAQHLITFGLIKIGERIDNEGWVSVSALL
jgi:hypothetical protein